MMTYNTMSKLKKNLKRSLLILLFVVNMYLLMCNKKNEIKGDKAKSFGVTNFRT